MAFWVLKRLFTEILGTHALDGLRQAKPLECILKLVKITCLYIYIVTLVLDQVHLMT